MLKKNFKKWKITLLKMQEIKNIRNIFRLKKENEETKVRVIRNTRNLFEHEDYYKPARVGNFWSNNYTEYDSNSNSNKTLSIKHYLNQTILKIYHILKT